MSMKKTSEKKVKRDTPKDERTSGTKSEEKLKKSIYNVSTPRFIQTSSTADIYAKKGTNVQSVNAPKKTSTINKINDNGSPMKDFLKSSPSNISQISSKSYRLGKSKSSIDEPKTPSSARHIDKPSSNNANSRNMGVAKKLPFTNVTVNSPIVRKKLNFDSDRIKANGKTIIDETPLKKVNKDGNKITDKKITKEQSKELAKRKEIIGSNSKIVLPERRRTKTRTLEEAEIKILTPDVVDNNLEILHMAKQLTAQPKAFYVELGEESSNPKLILDKNAKVSDDEVSYEDDFESYESDFDSYQSDISSPEDGRDCLSAHDDHDCQSHDCNDSNDSNFIQENDEVHLKEEKMLDSGNFDLRDSRSGPKSKPLDNILEDSQESDKKISLTDEGFQEMSSSSGLSSMKTLHVDILDRPLFIDFTKSKENRRKRKIFERLKQRADDILSMVTLHEISYDLFEMKPIPYDLYMATFGRLNYTQICVQTFDDGVTEEIQTDEIVVKEKWTQNPIEFSNNYFDNQKSVKKKDSVDNFAFLTNNIQEDNNVIDECYKSNPLRIYLEQKKGVGTNKILPYEIYKKKLQNDGYDAKKLRKFLKKVESRMSNVLINNSGHSMSNLKKTSKFPFSEEYLNISTKDIKDDEMTWLKNSQIIAAIFSDTKINLLITVHSKSSSSINKCILCLWDLSVAIVKPLKLLIATDNIKIGKFRGGTDGFLVGALSDGLSSPTKLVHIWDSVNIMLSGQAILLDRFLNFPVLRSCLNIFRAILLWDLTEQPNWCVKIANEEHAEPEANVSHEKRNYGDVYNLKHYTAQACAYTTSGQSVIHNDHNDGIVGLEFVGENTTLDNDRKILAQLCALQSIGILTIWSIIQEKSKTLKPDIGKAFWSKMKLEKNSTINLLEHVDMPHNVDTTDAIFNLNSAKKRMSKKRNERIRIKIVRPQSAILTGNVKSQGDSSSVVRKQNLEDNSNAWGISAVCNYLKIMNLNGVENYLVAKNGGEVLCCRKEVGNVKIKTFRVANAASSVTCIEVSPHGLPYFLAATDCGTVIMCSLLDHRVLLTLDCRNIPVTVSERCQSDSKGRYKGCVTVKHQAENDTDCKLPVTAVTWLQPNPFCIVATLSTSSVVWELTHSDIRAKCSSDGVACTSNRQSLALLTNEGELQVFKLTDSNKSCLELFHKYVALL